MAFISKKQKNHSRLNCKSNLRAKVNFELDSNLSQVHISEEFFFFFSFLCDLWLWYLPPNKRFKNKKKSFRSQIFSNFLILIYFILFDFIWFYLILFDFIWFIWFYLIYLIYSFICCFKKKTKCDCTLPKLKFEFSIQRSLQWEVPFISTQSQRKCATAF